VIAAALRLGPLLLASRSPQRRAILEQLGIEFDVVHPEYDELSLAGAGPREIATMHAAGKAHAVSAGAPDRPVLGVDTVVAIDGRALGKPRDSDQARSFLELLAGRQHEVHSGLCLIAGGRRYQRLATTRVRFRPLAAADVDWYLASGEWRERAGGYAIQGCGGALVARIDGDYTNVVGLPVAALLDAMGDAVR
jgi:nucleoside triphosphate pyrophosphatase